MKCIACRKKIDIFADVCPFCGEQQYDAPPRDNVVRNTVKIEPKIKEPMFTQEQAFMMHIHPDDELYRKFMELDILSKNYD